MLVYNIYINKITKRFSFKDRSFLVTLLLLEKLIKNTREATK